MICGEDASTASIEKVGERMANPAACDIPVVISWTAVLQIGLSVLFALATVATTLNANGVLLLQPDQLDLSPSTVLSALPGTLIFLALLGMLAFSTVLWTSVHNKVPVLCIASALPIFSCGQPLSSVPILAVVPG